MRALTNAEKHLIYETIKRIDNLLIEDWLRKSKRWRKRWDIKDLYE